MNRAMDFLPASDLEATTYPLNPQVHATDNLSVIETLIAQGTPSAAPSGSCPACR